MITYTCKKCDESFHPDGQTGRDSTCPHCHTRADEVFTELFWCDDCNVPLYDETCPRCGKKGHHFTSDARPVFPEERLLLEVLLNKPLAFLNDSVWNGTGNRYYVNGKRISFSVANLKNHDPDQVRLELARYMSQNNYNAFNCMIARWVEANSVRFGHITDEARDFVRKITEHFLDDETCAMFVSFSGGKDSTVVSDLVRKALSKPDIIHIFGNTTLEFPETYDYVTPFEHNAIARPLFCKCNEFGIEIQMIPFDPDTHMLDEDELERLFAVNPPDYVFVNHVSNVTGTIVPIEKIAALSKAYDALVVVDGSQSVGLLPIELKNSNIDYLVFAGHKNLYASWGIGGFVTNSSFPLKPVLSGGTGSDSLNLEMPPTTPAGFEFASPNIIAIASLHESLKWLKNVSIKEIAMHKDRLMQKLIAGLTACGVHLYLPSDVSSHTSVLSFNVPGYEADEIGVILNEDFDIAVRTGYHCAPFIHTFLNTIETKGTVRVSLGCFNTEEDVVALVDAIADIMED